MNDEAHGSGSGDEPTDSVLRPFEAPDQPPLPPIEPSRVVPDPPAAAEEPVPPPPPVDALADDPWSPVAQPVDEPEPAAAPADLADGDTDNTDDDASDHGESDSADEVPASDLHAEPADEPEPVAAMAVHTETPPETITLPRKPFLIGLGVLLAAVALLAALWQSAGDEEPETATDAPSREVAPVEEPEPDADDPDADESGVEVDEAPGDEAETTDTAPVDDTSAADLAEARAEIASLESEVQTLLDQPPPALDGDMLRRIVVGADAKFVSARPESVAVVGAFGGVSLIDPETNRVVANGSVADAATRVMRTPTSVWLTNYTDNQLLRVDPVTNTVAATFAFEGPDGIDKDGDTLVVASFDGEFVARVNPSDGAILQQVDVGGKPTDVISHPTHGLWAAVFDTGELVQIDPESFEILQRVVVGQGPVGIEADPSYLWVANHDEGTVAKIDPATAEVLFTVAVGAGPTETAVGGGSLWVTVTDDGALVEIDVTDGRIVSITPLGGASAGGGPTGIAFSEGTLWIAMQGEQSVVRIDLS